MFFSALTLQIVWFNFCLTLLLLLMPVHQVQLYISDVEIKHTLSLDKTYSDGENKSDGFTEQIT